VDRVSSRSYVSIAADVLTGTTSLKTQIRHRGIYDVPVYTATTQIKGEFEPKDLKQLLEPEDEVLWDQAFISVLVSDRRTFQNKVVLNWNDAKLAAEPGPVGRRDTLKNNISGIHFQALDIDPAARNEFDLELVMQGALNFGVVPNGRQVNWTLGSDWPDPSFSGLFLPTDREINDAGFTANWHLPQIARQQASIQRADKIGHLLRLAAVRGAGRYTHLSGGGEFNVKLFTPVDLYSQVDRALKYALLFIGMLMLSLYLIELVGRDQAVHVVQHLFVGMANVVFYLLLLSFSEQIGFNLAYLIAASATIGLIGGYCSVILKDRRRAAIVGVVLVAVYVLLWALLNLADYALIVGSLMVFAALAITMYATRNINWYNAHAE
ncbi:MAG: cell envelope integrity protein CreD, partial [Hyphomicrobiales bacterium]|nr:cell envelope integrity protein CreD [Hyphomicrobiales bacterium]